MSKFKKNDAQENEEIVSVIEESSSCKDESKRLLKQFIEEETKIVKGKFRNFETPGTNARIQVKKYAEVPMFDKIMEDGWTYEVPLYVARHLNGTDVTASRIGHKIHTCEQVTHGFKFGGSVDQLPQSQLDGAGIPVPIIQPMSWTRRYGFESLQFDIGG